MDKKALKDIEGVLDRKFDQKLKPVDKKLTSLTLYITSLALDMAEVKQRLDSLTLDIIDVQRKTDLLPDLHSMIKDTKEKADELDDRVERLETAA